MVVQVALTAYWIKVWKTEYISQQQYEHQYLHIETEKEENNQSKTTVISKPLFKEDKDTTLSYRSSYLMNAAEKMNEDKEIT